MRLKTLLGLAACAAATAGALTVAPAQAAQLPCFLSGSGNSATATCYSGASYTWRLTVDCLDTSNIRWPVTVATISGGYVRGDGTETLSCGGSLRANGRIEAR
ncbi:hypothetical protein QMK19_09180 [Streptomyces sp. H10-C2]|uniref:hypothetical protein n=1 Tax=unclassified Streptomyces TaxID=2593676 RepID=UPI0024BA66B9|nr:MULTISPECIES: hypothetical protein [unclassified Streptomyces]MDJ0340921.1 hypothetical protein [Streptomyces sp. PH10-H1]MDJ0369847.1 hypothetical protein [Streptomyces sp. H10-C2]